MKYLRVIYKMLNINNKMRLLRYLIEHSLISYYFINLLYKSCDFQEKSVYLQQLK